MQTDVTHVSESSRTLSTDNLLPNQDNYLLESGDTCQSEDSLATCNTRDSAHSLKSGSNGDICKGGYGYRFDFRSSCEFEFTEDVYI